MIDDKNSQCIKMVVTRLAIKINNESNYSVECTNLADHHLWRLGLGAKILFPETLR